MKIDQILKDKKFLILLIGHPLVGKSTFIKNKLNNLDFDLISRDNIIMSLSNSNDYTKAWNEVNHKNVDKILNNNLSDSVQNGKSVVIDMTNLTKKRRKTFLNRFNDDYYKIGIIFEFLSKDELSKRNKKREKEENKYINESIIYNMIDTYQLPTIDEGFNKIINANKII